MSLCRSLILGIRGSRPGDERLDRDLAACAEAAVAGVILFEHDLFTGETRNIESPGQVRELNALVREQLGDDTIISIDQEGGRVAQAQTGGGVRTAPLAAGDGGDGA